MAVISLAAPASAAPHMPAPIWRGVDEIAFACTGGPPGLCAAALVEAGRGAPVPVRAAAGPGGLGTLDLRLVATADGDATLVTLSAARAVEFDDSQGSLLPRTTRSAPGETVERMVARALDGILPWRRARRG